MKDLVGTTIPTTGLSVSWGGEEWASCTGRKMRIGYMNENLARTYQGGYLELLTNPLCDNLRTDPRFRLILEKERKTYEERLAKYGDI